MEPASMVVTSGARR